MHYYEDAEAVMALLVKLLHGSEIPTIANRTGLSQSGLYRIRSGKTKWARDTTLFCLIHYFGLRMMIVPSNPG